MPRLSSAINAVEKLTLCRAGAFVAVWRSRVLSQLVPVPSGFNPIPFQVDVHPNSSVLSFDLGISLLTAILFGLVPTLRATHVDLAPVLKESAHTVYAGKWRLGRLFVVGQLALSVVILVGAGLFLCSIAHLNSVDVGYSRTNVGLWQCIWPVAAIQLHSAYR